MFLKSFKFTLKADADTGIMYNVSLKSVSGTSLSGPGKWSGREDLNLRPQRDDIDIIA
jgi:hypothetical protein